MAPIPVTIITGFLGSGKTTLILNLLPQLPKGYKVALLKNEFGDLAVDSKLASAQAIGGVQELTNGCICCNLVGQLGDALDTLRTEASPSRIIIETSGSAFPATLAMEVNRIAGETGHYIIDGVVSVIDVENWEGYEDTSYTAKMQAKYTDLIILNKWELVSERRIEEVEDRILDLEVDIARIKSDKGVVPYDILIGLDSALAKIAADGGSVTLEQENGHEHKHDHQKEVDVLSVTLRRNGELDSTTGVDVKSLDDFLRAAPKEEVYRIKAILRAATTPIPAEGRPKNTENPGLQYYILNWAFGRWNFTQVSQPPTQVEVEMTIITARDEGRRWQKKLEGNGYLRLQGGGNSELSVRPVA